MMKKFNNLFEVNANDTLGTAVLKGTVKGYLQGVVAAGLGLGALAVGVMIISNKVESNEEEEEQTDGLDNDVEDDDENLEEIILVELNGHIQS